MQCKAVVFDLDDTLMAESEFAISGFRAVSQAFADILQDDDAAFQFMKETYRTGNRRKIFNLLFETWLKQPADRAAVHKMIHTYRAHTPDVNLLPDAERALQRLDAHRLADRCKLALISDGPAIMQRNKVTALGLEERLDLVVLTGELDGEFGKPHPRAYEIVSNTLEIPHSQCIYIADNVTKDFISPNALGWKSIRVLRDEGVYREAEPAEHGMPQVTIASLDELDEHLSL